MASTGPTAALAEKIDRLSASPCYLSYRRAREQVLRMKEYEAAHRQRIHEPSRYWEEELGNFDYMFDASPMIVDKLRHHTYHVTGLRVYDYRSNRDEAKERFEAKLRALIDVGDAGLLVPESPALGGFGFAIDGGLYNVDTLKFYEVLIALERGAILGDFRVPDRRRVVWEIGGGWGGFAYQFKTLFPETTFIITDFPELFLFSATYLTTAFPGAKVVFCAEPGDAHEVDDTTDFVFVPNTLHERVRPQQLDLTVNMVSFQEMREDQVEAYVRGAHEMECPYLYSLNRDRSGYNPEMTSVREIISRWYWPHEVPVLPVSYTRMAVGNPKKKPKPGKAAAKPDMDYKHVCGWRRVLA